MHIHPCTYVWNGNVLQLKLNKIQWLSADFFTYMYKDRSIHTCTCTYIHAHVCVILGIWWLTSSMYMYVCHGIIFITRRGGHYIFQCDIAWCHMCGTLNTCNCTLLSSKYTLYIHLYMKVSMHLNCYSAGEVGFLIELLAQPLSS